MTEMKLSNTALSAAVKAGSGDVSKKSNSSRVNLDMEKQHPFRKLSSNSPRSLQGFETLNYI